MDRNDFYLNNGNSQTKKKSKKKLLNYQINN